jgi:hypothetical protein
LYGTRDSEFIDINSHHYTENVDSFELSNFDFDFQEYVAWDPAEDNDASMKDLNLDKLTAPQPLDLDHVSDSIQNTPCSSLLATEYPTETRSCSSFLSLGATKLNVISSDMSSGILYAPEPKPHLPNATSQKVMKRSLEDTIPGFSCFDQWIESPLPSSKRIKSSTIQRKTRLHKKKSTVCLRCRMYKLRVSADKTLERLALVQHY